MPVEILEFNGISQETEAEEVPELLAFADIATVVRRPGGYASRSGKSDRPSNSPDVIPEYFEDLRAVGRSIVETKGSVDTAHDENAKGIDGESILVSDTEKEELQSAFILSEQRARQEGWEAGLTRGREESAETIRAERERFALQMKSLLGVFDVSHEDYLHRLEQEAVRLSLMCAARILHREVQIDPLALMGAVRTALGQLASSTEVRLVVPALDEMLWRESIALIPGLAHRPHVVADDAMEPGGCRIESDLGTADLSLVSQLAVLEEAMLQMPHDAPYREAIESLSTGSEPQRYTPADNHSIGLASSHEWRLKSGAAK